METRAPTKPRRPLETEKERLPLQFCADDEVVPGVRFGKPDQLLSPAYWLMRCQTADLGSMRFANRGGQLAEEIGFCLLGGYGVTVEVATAFYKRLRTAGVFEAHRVVPEHEILVMLTTPAQVKGRPHKYRFPNQRARRIHQAMSALTNMDVDDTDPVAFRDKIQALEGVGPKTASWITRNWLDADDVAILDIHVLRAGWTINLFDPTCRLPRDYLVLEKRFIEFSRALGIRASILDGVVWMDMRQFGSGLAREPTAV